MKNFKKLGTGVAVAGGVFVASAANAASVVTAAITGQLTDAQADVITVGGAILGLLVIVAAYKLVRRAM